MAISNDLLARLAAMTPAGTNGIGQGFIENGIAYSPRFTFQSTGTGENYEQQGAPVFAGYHAMNAADDRGRMTKPGTKFQEYDAQGNLVKEHEIAERDFMDKYGGKITLAMIAAMAGGAGLSAMGGAGAGAGGAGGFVGEGALSGVGAWDAALAGAPSWSAGAAGAAGGAVGPDFSMGFTDGGTAGGALDSAWATGSAGTPYTSLTSGGVVPGGGGAGGSGLLGKAASGVGSLTSSLGGASSLLGPAATLVGAAAGAQGTEGTTSERKMDPRLDNYVYGANGLMPMTQGLLQQQMPIAQQQGDYLRNFGQGLLGRGIAPNPFTGR